MDVTATTLYRFFNREDELLYVGISASAVTRWSQHSRLQPWWGEVDHVTIEHFASRPAALAAERAAIKEEAPRYNIVGGPGKAREWDLSEVTRLAHEHKKARDELADLIIEAREAGGSLRAIASLTGYSHEGVAKLVKRRTAERKAS